MSNPRNQFTAARGAGGGLIFLGGALLTMDSVAGDFGPMGSLTRITFSLSASVQSREPRLGSATSQKIARNKAHCPPRERAAWWEAGGTIPPGAVLSI